MSRRRILQAQPRRRRRVLLALTWYSIAIHRGITRFARDAGWIVDGGYVRSGSFTENWKGDGLIVVLGLNPEIDAAALRLSVPTVNIGYETKPGIATVGANSAAIGKLAAEHFLSRGFRHFAFYETQRRPGETSRRDGFEETLQKAGHRVHRIGMPTAREQLPNASDDQREQIVGRQLMALPKPVAVTAEYDDLAIQVIDAALAVGLSVPEQVAVLGVDNDELHCPFAPIPLSSIDNDEERVGYEAARQLQKMMDGHPAPQQPIWIPPRRVVVRQSTNILAIPHEHVASALRMIWQHYTEPIDATRVAAEIPLSYTQLHESFVKHVGHSMAEEIEQRRIEHAQRLLGDTDTKLSEVARRSGFGSADRMGRVFRRALNLTPSDYREQIRHGTDVVPSGQTAERPTHAKPAALEGIGPESRDDPSSVEPALSGGAY